MVFGTLGCLLIVILIIWTLVEVIGEFSRRAPNRNTEIVSNEKAKENYQHNKRKHQVSFESFELVDTANSIYIIPVSQTALKIDEYIARKDIMSESKASLDMYGGHSDFYYDSRSLNNILVYDARNQSVRKLFNDRLSINRVNIEQILGKYYVLLAVTDKDTNKDGLLDENDTKALYVYSTTTATLNRVDYNSGDFVDYSVVSGRNQLVIRYGLDKNGDGNYTWDEPI